MTDFKPIQHIYLLLSLTLSLILVWYTIDIFLLAFAGILLAIAMRSMSNIIAKYCRIPCNFALTTVVIGLIFSLFILCFLIAPAIGKQFTELYAKLPQAWDKFNNDYLSLINAKMSIGDARKINLQEILPQSPNMLLKLSGIFTSTFGFFGNLLVILFFGFSFAFQAEIYVNGFTQLFPKRKQILVSHTLLKITTTLRFWLAGKVFSILVIGLLTWGGLEILQVPLAFTLAFLAALLSFLPNVGPIIAAIPAILLALLQGPTSAFYVAGLYLFIQVIDGYFITPVIQQKSMSLPPGLVVFVQLIMALLTGILGLTLATPLLAIVNVLVVQLYLNRQEEFMD